MRTAVGKLIGTFFGCGYSRIAPGTVGSVAALLLAIVLHERHGMPAWGYLALAAVCFVPAAWAAGVTAEAVKIKDPGCVVVDEALGQWIALGGALRFRWPAYLGALLLFRLFDIWKPWPVRNLEALPGGVGIVADDVMAGLYAALVLLLAGWFNLY